MAVASMSAWGSKTLSDKEDRQMIPVGQGESCTSLQGMVLGLTLAIQHTSGRLGKVHCRRTTIGL